MGEHKNWSELSSSQLPLKKMIPQLLLSVSIFSFMFSYSSLYTSSSSSFFVYSPKFQFFSANYFQLVRCALNKNCIFLICNGLLVFLAKTSGFIGPPSDYDNNFNDVLHKKIGLEDLKENIVLDNYYVSEEISDDETKEDQEDVEGDEEESGRGKEVSIFIAESEEEGRVEKDIHHEEEDELSTTAESRSFWLFDDDDDDDQKQLLYGVQQVEEEEEDHDQEEEEEEDQEGDDDDEKVELSTKELNQKFEDFIRRMKEEIIINEARQKVVINM